MTWIAKLSKMDPKTKQQNLCPIPEPVRKFFWDRHVDRALSKLANSIRPKNLQRLDVGFCGDVNLTMGIMDIQINRTVPDPVCICMWCGSALESAECLTCYPLVIGHKKGWCYFVIENFQGRDYSVVFTNNDSFNYEEMCADIGHPIENDYIGPYVARNLNVSARPMGIKRRK